MEAKSILEASWGVLGPLVRPVTPKGTKMTLKLHQNDTEMARKCDENYIKHRVKMKIELMKKTIQTLMQPCSHIAAAE